MILLRILYHELHRSRNVKASALGVEIPAIVDFLPAIVSTTRGKFVVSRHVTCGDLVVVKPPSGHLVLKRGGQVVTAAVDTSKMQFYILSGTFTANSDHLDSYLGGLFTAAYELAISDNMGNVFEGPKAVSRALAYVRSSSGLKAQPHVCLVPSSWTQRYTASFFGKDYDARTGKYSGCCRVVPCNVVVPVFLSRPDMVGMYTQFMGGGSSIVLNNVERGLAFCPDSRRRSAAS